MTKVFVIDDSLSVRNGFKTLFSTMNDIELIGEAENPIDAFEVFKKVGLPDLFILDIEMPKMDGLTFLKQINAQRPTPVIICSTIVENGSNVLIDALRLGAADIIEKPKNNVSSLFIEYREELMLKIRAVAHSNINYYKNITHKKLTKISHKNRSSMKAVFIGCSTGGIQVLEEIITHLEPVHCAIIVVQHIPKGFSSSLAKRLNELSQYTYIKEVDDGEEIIDNTMYIAPGGKHLEVEKKSLKYCLRLKDFPRVNSHRPSVNVLFNSAAQTFKSHAVGFILTGMGDDGAIGLKKMRESGAKTYVQNEQTSTVFGMPKVALENKSAIKALSIYEIIQVINQEQ